jgi:two-component system, cell cycle sensor histidine kinase and response regulator CckA
MTPHALVLLVEDNPITRKMLRFALESEGYETMEAGDGETALAQATKRVPALILQDYVLPDMDGLSLLERFRALPGCAEVPALVLTGMVSQLEELRGRAHGPTTFLGKPIEPSRLLGVVGTHLAEAPPSVGQGRTVLIVDDEPLNRKLAALRFRDAGYEVVTATGGEAALEELAKARPDVIVSDVLMPGMDGFRLCQAVRGDLRSSHVPIVLLSSAYIDGPDYRLAREMGASALLVRTPDFRECLAEVAKCVATGASPPAATPLSTTVSALHGERIQIQLERQVARNEALLRQGAIQAAALSVVRGLAAALSSPAELPSILADVLVHCLDAAGLSTGVLYLVGPDGRLRVQAQAGVPLGAREQASSCFGHPEILERVLAGGEPYSYSVAKAPAADLRDLAARLAQTSGLIIPFVVEQERLGVLLLAADSQDLSESVWTGFARALAVQFGQTIALGQSLSRGAASETRYRSLMEHANDAILLLDQSSVIVEANRATEGLLGRPRAEVVGRRYEDFVDPAQRGALADEGSPLLTSGAARLENRRLIRGDGSLVAVDASTALVNFASQTLSLVILRDITLQKEGEQKLRQSQEEYRLLFDRNPHPMWVEDLETLAFLDVNDAALRHYGYSRSEFLGMNAREIRPPQQVAALLAGRAKEALEWSRVAVRAGGEATHLRKDGSPLTTEISLSPLVFRERRAWLILAHDVTEKRRLEAQLLQSQKMEAVGQLAGGVAHDFNNLLGVITGYTELLLKELGPNHPGQKRAEEVKKAAERAAGLTRQLLAFSRKQVLEPKILDLNRVVGDIETMLRRLIGEDILLVTSLAHGVGLVKADPGQVEQVLVNLVVNARDAMPGGGRMTLETKNVDLDQGYARTHREMEPGAYVMLSVSDTGHGMDAATMSHIFEPFYTTKPEGKGTGLGLSTAYGIVKQSGGDLTVYSEVGQGTTFKVFLPRAEGETDDRSAAEGAPVPRASETILVAEDEEALRGLICEILEGGGYRVLQAEGPAQALSLAAAHDGPIHLVLTDMVMPQLSGRELVERLHATRPTIRAVYMSGYTDETIRHNAKIGPGTHFLQKPFSEAALLRLLRTAFEEPRSD